MHMCHFLLHLLLLLAALNNVHLLKYKLRLCYQDLDLSENLAKVHKDRHVWLIEIAVWVNFSLFNVIIFFKNIKGFLTDEKKNAPMCIFSLQETGKQPEELLNPAEYMGYQRVCNIEQLPESQSAPACPPVTFLPQHPYTQHPTNEPMYSNTSFPTNAPRAAFSFPKEQSVWPSNITICLSKRQLVSPTNAPKKRC